MPALAVLLTLAAWYTLVSLITLALYAHDKSRARKGEWRVRERTLHWCSLAGGWPGALLAQRMFKHKSRKASFRLLFFLTVLGNCVVMAGGVLLWSGTLDMGRRHIPGTVTFSVPISLPSEPLTPCRTSSLA